MTANRDWAADREEARHRVLGEVMRTYRGYAASGYGQRWERPKAGMSRAVEERNGWLRAALEPAAGGVIVDLGCGSGWLAVLLDGAGVRPRRYVGVDLLPERLALARAAVPWGDFQEASADRVDLPDGSADAVAALTLFSSLRPQWFRIAVAEEVRRVLRPGGRLIVYDLRYPSPLNLRVRPVRRSDLAQLFPGWPIDVRTMTLLPPLVRTRLAAGHRRYALLSSVPGLRSHLGAVLVKPG